MGVLLELAFALLKSISSTLVRFLKVLSGVGEASLGDSTSGLLIGNSQTTGGNTE